MLLQIRDHVTDRLLIGLRNVFRERLLELQLVTFRFIELGVDDLLITRDLLLGQLASLIVRHGFIRGLQVGDVRLGGLVQLRHVVGELGKDVPELLEVIVVLGYRRLLQRPDGVHRALLRRAGRAGIVRVGNGLHAGLIRLLHLLPVFRRKGALGVVLVVVDLIELLAQTKLRRGRVSRRVHMHENGGAYGVVTLNVVDLIGVDECVALVVEGQRRLTVFVGDGVGVVVTVSCRDLVFCRCRRSAVDGGTHDRLLAVIFDRKGQGGRGRDADGKRFTRCDLRRRFDRAVAEVRRNVHHQLGVIADLTGELDAARPDANQRQRVAVMQPDGFQHLVCVAIACEVLTIDELAVEEEQRLRAVGRVVARQQRAALLARSVQDVIRARVCIQRHALREQVRVVERLRQSNMLQVDIRRIDHGHLHLNLVF